MWGTEQRPGPLMVPPPPTGSRQRLAAAALLVLAAALTLGGSFGALTVSVSDYVGPRSPPSPTTFTRTAWAQRIEPPPDLDVVITTPLDGYLLSAGVLCALAAVVVLVTTGRQPGGRAWGRSAGVGAAALLTGVIAEMWTGLIEALIVNVKSAELRKPDSGVRAELDLGPGAWLLLLALGCAIVAGVLLLVSARSDPPHPAGPAYGP